MQSIPETFRRQVQADPSHPAVGLDDRTLTYRELDAATDAVGHAVLRRARRPGQRVVLLADQGLDAIVATLAILKAGSAYVPLDPQLPLAELERIVGAVEPALVVAERRYTELARRLAVSGVDWMHIDPALADATSAEALPPVPPESLAYIYFTSGSTGQPKGVCDSHLNVVHNVHRYTVTLQITANDRLTLLQAPHFSGAVSSLFGALLNGASAHPYDVRSRGLSGAAAWMRSHAITIYHSVPFIFRQILPEEEFPELRCIRLEGDRASRRDIEIFKRHCRPGAVLANGLGATECGLVRQWRIDTSAPLPEGPVPIGGPVPDMEVVLLSDDGAEVAHGEVGEIAVKSRYLALGYWRQPELTARRFRTDPADASVRLYRSGDLGRFTGEGSLQYLGRKDAHAKMLGKWVDLQTLENALHSLPGVRDAVAAVQYDDDSPSVVAYLVLGRDGRFDPGAFRRMLAARVPAAILPSHWIAIDNLPLQANLKVDRGALPWPPGRLHSQRTTGAQADSDLEAMLCGIWSDVLGVACVEAQDDFLSLGGDSLAVVRINNRLRSQFGCELPLESLFGHRSVRDIAAELRNRLRDIGQPPGRWRCRPNDTDERVPESKPASACRSSIPRQ